MSLFGQVSADGLPATSFTGGVTLLTDVHEGQFGLWAIGMTGVGRVLVELDRKAGRGDFLEGSGTVRGGPGRAGGHSYRAVLDLGAIDTATTSRFLPHRVGRFVRDSVIENLEPYDDGRALLAGFLIGDTSRIAPADIVAMRRSGLAHFVAVSGSNVALFLGLLAVVAGPLAMGPKKRAVVGLLGLPIYAAATRFEPSVMRASVMAAVALGGRIIGLVLEAWQLLSLAVAVLIILDPQLTSNVGFQLSVAATAGVLVGARWPVGGLIGRTLTITIAAQLAVAPLLMLHFGTVPLLSPLVNLIAAPLVTAATVTGAVGAAGVGVLVGPASWLANLVLELARGAAGWPQLSSWGLVVVLTLALFVTFLPGLRPLIAAGVTVAICVVLVSPAHRLEPGSVVVLDVGQGDAILLYGGAAGYGLIDGGPDGARLLDRLRYYGVTSLEFIVATHAHADHVAGLIDLVGRYRIGKVWADFAPHSAPASKEFMDAVGAAGIEVEAPTRGSHFDFGVLDIEVLGPIRRYASTNDQSIVLEVWGPVRSFLASGDIETFAQSDVGRVRADVLKVPHHGGATSSPEWLVDVGATTAVISVGENDFGHPSALVVETLLGSGTEVLRTDVDGDVVIDLSTDGPPDLG